MQQCSSSAGGGGISRDGDMDVDSGGTVEVRVGGPPLRP